MMMMMFIGLLHACDGCHVLACQGMKQEEEEPGFGFMTCPCGLVNSLMPPHPSLVSRPLHPPGRLFHSHSQEHLSEKDHAPTAQVPAEPFSWQVFQGFEESRQVNALTC